MKTFNTIIFIVLAWVILSIGYHNSQISHDIPYPEFPKGTSYLNITPQECLERGY